MIRFGTVGTSWITGAFLDALSRCPDARLGGVYSRSLEKARRFGEQHGSPFFCDDLSALSEQVDAVYIASPNSLHYDQTRFFLERGIPVLCEKPLASNAGQAREMYRLAWERKVLVMEAYKSGFLPGFAKLREWIPRVGQVRNVVAFFSRYSSRYDAHKRGENVNTFRAEFSNGAMMDMGIYCLYPALMLFGSPQRVIGDGIPVPGGVDGVGTLVLRYPDFLVTLNTSKVSDCFQTCEIQGEEGTLIADSWYCPTRITLRLRDGACEESTFPTPTDGESMEGEVREFLSCLRRGQAASDRNTPALSLEALRIIDAYRAFCGISYPADL